LKKKQNQKHYKKKTEKHKIKIKNSKTNPEKSKRLMIKQLKFSKNIMYPDECILVKRIISNGISRGIISQFQPICCINCKLYIDPTRNPEQKPKNCK